MEVLKDQERGIVPRDASPDELGEEKAKPKYESSSIYYTPVPNSDDRIDEIFAWIKRKEYPLNQAGFDQACRDLKYKDLMISNSDREDLKYYADEYEQIIEDTHCSYLDRKQIWGKNMEATELIVKLRKYLIYWCLKMAEKLKKTELYQNNQELLTDIDQIPYMMLIELGNPTKWILSNLFTSLEQFNDIRSVIMKSRFQPINSASFVGLDIEIPDKLKHLMCRLSDGNLYYSTYIEKLDQYLYNIWDKRLNMLLSQYTDRKKADIMALREFYDDWEKRIESKYPIHIIGEWEKIPFKHDTIHRLSHINLKSHIERGFIPKDLITRTRLAVLRFDKQLLQKVFYDILIPKNPSNFDYYWIYNPTPPIMNYPFYHILKTRGYFEKIKEAHIYLLKGNLEEMNISLEEAMQKYEEIKKNYNDACEMNLKKDIEIDDLKKKHDGKLGVTLIDSMEGLKLIIDIKDVERPILIFSQNGKPIEPEQKESHGRAKSTLSAKQVINITAMLRLIRENDHKQDELEILIKKDGGGLYANKNESIDIKSIAREWEKEGKSEESTQNKVQEYINTINSDIRKMIDLKTKEKKGDHGFKLFRIKDSNIILNCEIKIQCGYKNKDAKNLS